MKKEALKDSVIVIRVTRAEREQFKRDAEIAGISLSELIRRRYYGKPIIPRVEYKLIDELRRQGGLLKANFNTMREAGVSKDVIDKQQEVYKDIVRLIEKISASFGKP